MQYSIFKFPNAVSLHQRYQHQPLVTSASIPEDSRPVPSNVNFPSQLHHLHIACNLQPQHWRPLPAMTVPRPVDDTCHAQYRPESPAVSVLTLAVSIQLTMMWIQLSVVSTPKAVISPGFFKPSPWHRQTQSSLLSARYDASPIPATGVVLNPDIFFRPWQQNSVILSRGRL